MRARFATDRSMREQPTEQLHAPRPLDLETLRPGDIVYEEPDIDACNLDEVSASDMDSALVVVADEQGRLYGMYLKGGVRDADSKPYGPLYPLTPFSKLFATQSEALLAQAENERDEAREHSRRAERLQEMAIELGLQAR